MKAHDRVQCHMGFKGTVAEIVLDDQLKPLVYFIGDEGAEVLYPPEYLTIISEPKDWTVTLQAFPVEVTVTVTANSATDAERKVRRMYSDHSITWETKRIIPNAG